MHSSCALHWFALVCIGVHWFASVCIVCIGLHWIALVCIGVHWCALYFECIPVVLCIGARDEGGIGNDLQLSAAHLRIVLQVKIFFHLRILSPDLNIPQIFHLKILSVFTQPQVGQKVFANNLRFLLPVLCMGMDTTFRGATSGWTGWDWMVNRAGQG